MNHGASRKQRNVETGFHVRNATYVRTRPFYARTAAPIRFVKVDSRARAELALNTHVRLWHVGDGVCVCVYTIRLLVVALDTRQRQTTNTCFGCARFDRLAIRGPGI